MVSAAMAAAGALYAHRAHVDPDVFLFIYTVTMVIMVIGGKGTLIGPIVGGLIFGLLAGLVLRFARSPRCSGWCTACCPGRLLPAQWHRAGRAQVVAGSWR